MKVSVIGSGYVGLVAAACFAEMGNSVMCIDINEEKIKKLKKGIIPIYEPGLEKLVLNNLQKGDLSFSTDIIDALKFDIVFIAVGTPMGEDGSADLKYVLQVAKQIGENISHDLIIVNKSTVPIGTADKVKEVIMNSMKKNNKNYNFHIVSNPEFLKEGVAIKDFMHPDRVVVGSDNNHVIEKMKILYSPFLLSNDRFIDMDIRSAEMTKYAANSMLATKISFINEIANICEKVGANVNKVRIGIGSDNRIGYKFIYPGCGYGGSCFPKDVQALIKIANKHNYNPQLISAVESVNKLQKDVLFNKIKVNFNDKIKEMTFAIWGLSFKPETDDMREAPSINLIKSIKKFGGVVNAYDPKATHEAKFYLKNQQVNYFDDKYSVLKNADVLVLVTEWKEFRSPNFNKILRLMKGNTIIDGRNQYNSDFLKEIGFNYYQIGVKDNS